jgi:hypothetical protein
LFQEAFYKSKCKWLETNVGPLQDGIQWWTSMFDKVFDSEHSVHAFMLLLRCFNFKGEVRNLNFPWLSILQLQRINNWKEFYECKILQGKRNLKLWDI